MNLAYFYPIIYWNTANLIVDSASFNQDEEEADNDVEDDSESSIEYDSDDYDEYDFIEVLDSNGKVKKVKKTVNYGKVSMAITRFKSYGIDILPPNINVSNYTFTPNEKTNTITYGLRGITRISDDLIKNIILNRPYSSVADFRNKIKLNKLQLLNLIKSGAFDNISEKSRMELLKDFIWSVCDIKQKLTLQNMQSLINYEVIPDDMAFYAKLFLFNKFLKTCKNNDYYNLTDEAVRFVSNNLNPDLIDNSNQILQKAWDNFYKKAMDPMRDYLKKNSKVLLNKLNQAIFSQEWNKYCNGNISKFEMDSIGFYYHEHELQKAAKNYDDYYSLPEEPIIEYQFESKNGITIPIYKTSLLIGTVIDKDKAHNTIALLTPTGMVTVKIYKQQWPIYDKQISERGEDGVKHVKEKSWLSRGNLLMVQGIKRDGSFILKKYKKSAFPVITKITNVNDDGSLQFQYERLEAEE